MYCPLHMQRNKLGHRSNLSDTALRRQLSVERSPRQLDKENLPPRNRPPEVYLCVVIFIRTLKYAKIPPYSVYACIWIIKIQC